MAERSLTAPWPDLARRHERRLAALWIAGVALLFVAMAVRPVRIRLLNALQWAATRYDARWDRRLAEGRGLVNQGRFEEAAGFLERLDAEFPARTSRYGRDKQREYLLRLLARSYEAAGRKTRAMATWERLRTFDSLNYRNHFGYAQAAERLSSGWAVAPEAREGFARALDLLPSHLPSLRGYIAFHNDRGEWRDVAAAYRTYLDAFLLEQVTLRIGNSTRSLPVLVDGRPHDLDVAIAVPPGWIGDLTLTSSTYPIALERVAVLPAVTVGAAARREPRAVSLAALTTSAMVRGGAGWVPADSAAALRVPLQAGATGLARVSLRLRLFKLLDAPLWALVSRAYRNLLDAPGLAEAGSRTALFGVPAAADTAFGRLDWTREGQYIPESP